MRLFFIYFICSISSICSIFGSNYICTDKFDLKNGLPNNGITTLLQDEKGYIWVGTYDGLSRYNGHSFVTFSNSIENKIFQSNRIRSLFEDKYSNIWIGTDFGVTIYNREIGQFRNIESGFDNTPNQECIIREIMSSEDGSQIYCLTERSGVLIYSNSGTLLKNFTVDRDALFQDALHLADEKYLLASNKGILLYDFQTAEVRNIYKTNGASNFVGTLSKLNDDTILYGSSNGIRAIKCDLSSYKFNAESSYTYSENGVKSLEIDENGDLWVGTLSQGLFYLEDADANWGSPLNQLTKPMRVSSLLSPLSGSMWVATFDNGLLRYSKDHNYFKTLDLAGLNVRPIRSVQFLQYDTNHILYQNSYHNLSLYDIRNGEERRLPFSISSADLKKLQYITKLKCGDIWLFMSDGKRSWRLINPRNTTSLIRIDDAIMSDFSYDFPYTITEDN